MSKFLTDSTFYPAIADAIRAKGGASGALRPGDMAAAIRNISGGGGSAVIESKNITANGTYTAPTGVDGYNPVTVAVQPNLQSKTATENGTVAPDSGYDGLSSVVVDVQGASVYAFARVIYVPGTIVTATSGGTTVTGDDSGDCVLAIPSSGTWVFSDGTNTNSVDFAAYGESKLVPVFQIVSLVPQLTSLTGSNGSVIYNTSKTYNWSSNGDVWKAFDGNTTAYGQYKSENQSDFWIGYQFNNAVFIASVDFYGGNYSASDSFEVIVEILDDETWVEVGRFVQAGNNTSVKSVTITKKTNAVRLRSPTTKTSGHNLFIKEIVINGAELG